MGSKLSLILSKGMHDEREQDEGCVNLLEGLGLSENQGVSELL